MATAAPPAAVPGPATARKPRLYYGYWIVGAALIAQFVSVGTQMQVAGAFFKPMTEDMDWTRAEFTYAQTVGRFLMAFVGVLVGVWIDRYGGRVLMVVGVTVLGMGLFLTSAITELWQWVLLRGVMFTLGAALMGNLVVNVTLSKWWVERRGQMVGIAAIGVSAAGVVMPPLMTGFIDDFGWRAGWRALAILAWLFIYPVAMLMRRQPEDYGLHPDGKSDEEVASGGAERAAADFANSFTRGEALRTRALYLIVVAFGLSGIAIGTVLFQTIPYLTDEGFSRGTASLMMTVLSVPAMLSKPVWGTFIDRLTPRYLAAASFAFTGVAMGVIVLGATAASLKIVFAGYLLFGLGVGGTIPLQEVIWASYFGRRYLGAVRSVAMPFSLFLGAGGPLVVSYYFDVVGNYHGAFLAIAVITAMAAFIIVGVRPPKRPQPAGGPPPPPTGGDGAAPVPVAAAPPGAAASPPQDGSGASAGPGGDGAPAEAAPEPEPAVAVTAGAAGETPAGAAAPPATGRPRIPARDYMGGDGSAAGTGAGR